MKSSTILLRYGLVACALCLLSTSAVGQTFSEHGNGGMMLLGPSPVNFSSISASLADIDNDSDLDIFFAGTGAATRQMFRNNLIGTGTFNFTNVTASWLPTAVASTVGESWSAAWGDYDGDGRVDVFVGQTNSGTTGDVLRNNGPTGFTNESTATNLDDPGFHQNVAWSDIDNDRDLDLIIAMEGPTELHEVYRHDPGHVFTPIGASTGIQAPAGVKAYGMAIGDTDGDGDMDIYISTCRGDNNIRNNFFENRLVETGSLSFVDIAGNSATDPNGNGTQFTTNSYNAEFHDFDNDSDLDLFMVGADREPSKIFRNNGDNQFTDVDTITGHPLLTDVGRDFNGGRAVDYDNDGDLDLFFHDHLSQSGVSNQARKLYRNDGNWQFTDVTTAEGLAFQNQGAYDSTWGDLDRDGDQDLIAPTNSSWNERVFISSATSNGNHWLYVELAGQAPNTTAIGATVYATLNSGTPQQFTLRRESNTNAGTFNQSDLPGHFGLGLETTIDQLRVVWPDGTMQYLFDVAVDQYLTIAYASAIPGDFNGDGTVDAGDYVLWRKGAGDQYTQADFNLWRAHFGQTSGGGSAASASVPEPTTAWVLVLPAVLAIRRRRASTVAIP